MPRVFLPAILSGVLLWTAFFPLNLGPVGFFALVPWLSLVRADVSRRRRYLAAYLGGVTFFVLATQWIRVAHPMMYMSWIGLSVVMPITWVFALDLIRRLDRLGVPLAFAVPIGWVALEYARMHFPTGFPILRYVGWQHMIGFGWYYLGYTQHAFAHLLQIADLGGVYAVSFLVAAVNGTIAEWALQCGTVRRWLRWQQPNPFPEKAEGEDNSPSPTGGGAASEASGVGSSAIAPTLAVLALLAVSLGYGFVRLSHPEFAAGPRVTSIQGSVPQDEKILRGGELRRSYSALHIQAMETEPKPDLIVWPETCFPGDWLDIAPGETPSDTFANDAAKARSYFASLRLGAPTLLGLNGIEWEGGRGWKYNSALLLDTAGQKVGRYDKMHLVPFGEYVPLGETLPFMSMFTPYKHDYACRPGRSWTRFPLAANGKTYTFGCLICYEDSDPSLAREYVRTEPVDFLVNISNDGWFDGTEEHEQHLAICRFRAVESRRSIVRSVNMGISGVIDPDGKVIALPADSWHGSKKMEGVVSAVVPIDNRGSLYATLGDWVPGLCWLGVLLGFVAARRNATRGAA